MLEMLHLLRSDGSIVINKNLARNIGIDAAIMYSELLSKYCYFEMKGELTEDGYFYCTIDRMEHDTCLTEYSQNKAVKKLADIGLIATKLKGVPAKRHFKILEDELLIKHLIKPTIKIK